MPEEKPITPAESGTDIDRRSFFVKLGLGSLSIAAAGTAAFSYQFPVDSVTLDVNSGIYLVHAKEGFFSLSAICTHLGCMTAWKPELGIIACPCHGSKFYVLDPKKVPGTKIEGPAPRPLPWLQTSLSDEGDLMVDRSKQIDPMKFLRV